VTKNAPARRLGIAITLEAPTLLAAAPPASNLTFTLEHVPGNSVRGLLARRALELGWQPAEAAFRRLFVDGEARFGSAPPEGAEVIPLSARTCKYQGGFLAGGGHGVEDLALRSEPPGPCGRCQRPMDYFEGCHRPGRGEVVAVRTRLLTRTAIDPVRGTARSGQLFSQQVLEEGQRFVAAAEAPGELAAKLEALMLEPFCASVGTGASRGQGWVRVAAAPAPAGGPKGGARQRYEACRQRLGRPVLVVTLLSDGLFRDDYLREATVPAPRHLGALGLDPGDWQPAPSRAFMDLRRIFGFDGPPLSLPRPHRLAVAAGSVFVYERRDGVAAPRVPAGTGVGWIGDGQRDGYGRAVLWHPFHLDPEGAGGVP
jgi:CRISPR-associated protein Csx10